MSPKKAEPSVRIGEAAEALGVSVETLRRWEGRGTLAVTRSPGGQRLNATSITVLAASSLQAAFIAAAKVYERTYPDTTLTFGFDASSALRTKIEQGAPADLFASADIINAQKLVQDGFAIGPVQPFAGNRLAIVVPSENPAHIVAPFDLV